MPKPITEESRAVRMVHYVMDDVTIGVAKGVRLYAIRCSYCAGDFHMDNVPVFCPCCGERFVNTVPFGKAK